MKVKFSKEQLSLFDQLGTIITTSKGHIYQYIPFWFKTTQEEDIFELFTFEELPDEVIKPMGSVRRNRILPVIFDSFGIEIKEGDKIELLENYHVLEKKRGYKLMYSPLWKKYGILIEDIDIWVDLDELNKKGIKFRLLT
uniref:Uncharacterized protein n=1 Tax=viral metagenome TaxID=1070528 RepID=A0A6M3LX62_9ZZZZ